MSQEPAQVETPEPLCQKAVANRAAALFVWGAWVIMLGIALDFVHRYAVRMPCGDDWTALAGAVSGQQVLTLEYLWKQTNEHRLPLIKAILVSLSRLSNGNFHLENYLNVLALGGLSAALIVTARRLRGHMSFTDAVFPLALLHPGHFEVFVSRITLNHVLSTVLIGLVLALLASHRGRLSIRRLCLMGVLLLSLPLCGANGLPVVLVCAVWLVLGPNGADQPKRLWHLGLAALLVAFVGFYFVGLHSLPHHPSPPSLSALGWTFAATLSTSFVSWQPDLWHWTLPLVPALLLATGVLLIRTWYRNPEERGRALALLLFLGGTVGVVGGLAWGRAGLGPEAAVAPRYAVIAVPILLAVYLAWVLYTPLRLRGLVECALFTLFCLTFPLNAQRGYAAGAWIRPQDKAFAKALKEGVPPAFLADRYAGIFWSVKFVPRIVERITWFRQAGLRRFRQPAEEPTWEEVPIARTPTSTYEMTQDGRAWDAHGTDPQLLFTLPEPQFVHALRIRCVLNRADAIPASLQLYWMQRGVNSFTDPERTAVFGVLPDSNERTLMIWVNDTIDQFRIDPDVKPCQFELREITLLRKKEVP